MRLLRLLQIPIVAALFAVLLVRADLTETGDALADMNPWVLSLVAALNLPILLLFAVRSHVILARLGHRLPHDVALPVAILGNVAGSQTPASSGEILRAIALRTHADVAAADASALVLLERGVSTYSLTIGTAAVFSLITLPQPVAIIAAIGLLALLPLPIVAAPLVTRIPPARESQPPLLRAILRPIHEVSQRLRFVLGDWRSMSSWMLVTAGVFSVVTLQFWLITQEVDSSISPAEAWVAFGASQLAGIVSLLPLGLGASDTSLAAILHRFGMTFDEGAGVAILVRAAVTVPLVLIAALSYFFLQWKARRSASKVASLSAAE